MRQPTKSKKVNIDLTKPIQVQKFEPPTDCYGKKFDIQNQKCSTCHDNETCGIIFKDFVDEKAKKLLKGRLTLDVVDFGAVEDKKAGILAFFKKRPAYKAFKQYVSQLSKCEDDLSVKQFSDTFIKENGFYIKNGKITANGM